MKVQPKIAMDQKRKWNLMEDKITTIVEEMEDRQHLLFSGLNSGLSNEAKQAAKECVAKLHHPHIIADVKSQLCLEIRSFPWQFYKHLVFCISQN